MTAIYIAPYRDSMDFNSLPLLTNFYRDDRYINLSYSGYKHIVVRWHH
jgi:hypothetical protein